MKALKNFLELLKVVWKDKVTVAMLLIWIAFIVYLYVGIDSIQKSGAIEEESFTMKVLENSWAGTAFFWLFGFTSQLRIAWHKIQLAKKDAQNKH